MEETEVWIARDEDNHIWLHKDKPCKKSDGWWVSKKFVMALDENTFPSVKWEDEEPTRAKIILNE